MKLTPEYDAKWDEANDGGGGGDDALLVNFNPRKAGGLGAGGDDRVRGLQNLGAAVVLDDLHGVRVPEASVSVDHGDLVLVHQVLHPGAGLRHDFVLAAAHLLPVDPQPGHLDAVLGEIRLGGVEMLGGVEQRLGGDATHVEAGAAERGITLDQRGLQAKLRTADRGDIAAGAGANYGDVVVGHGA